MTTKPNTKEELIAWIHWDGTGKPKYPHLKRAIDDATAAVVLLDGNKSRLRDKRETDTHCRYCGGSGLNINSNQAMPNCAWCNGTGDAFDQE